MALWRGAADWAPFLVFLAILVTGLIIAAFFAANSGAGAFMGISAVFFVIATFSSISTYQSITERAPGEVTKAADSASQGGLAAKKAEVSMRYAELLNYTFTEMLPLQGVDLTKNSMLVKVCTGNRDADSTCPEFEHVYDVDPYQVCVGWDDDDDTCNDWETRWHHQHDPDVKALLRYAGQSNLPDIYATPETNLVPDAGNANHPLMFFSGWMLPPNYQDLWYSNFRTKFNMVDYTAPVDWMYYVNLQTTRGSTSWHQYSNPLLATANAGFIGDPAIIAKLQAAHMLLEPRDLYSPAKGNTPTYFDFVYPLGKFGAENVDWAGFTTDAQNVNMYYGNVLHISNSFAFVSEEELNATGVSLDDLVYNMRADLYNGKWKKVFGDKTLYTIMQQNTILTTCVVSNGPDGRYIKPAGCRVMSGLPIGNETLKEAMASGIPDELQKIPFTPEGFFGKPALIIAADGKLSLTGTQGTPMGLWERYGAKKPSMEDNFNYLIDRVVLSQDEINQVISAAVSQQAAITGGFTFWPTLILVIELVCGVLFGLIVWTHQ